MSPEQIDRALNIAQSFRDLGLMFLAVLAFTVGVYLVKK